MSDAIQIVFEPVGGESRPFLARVQGSQMEIVPRKPFAVHPDVARQFLHPETGNSRFRFVTPDADRLWPVEERRAMKQRALPHWPHPTCHLTDEQAAEAEEEVPG